MTLVPVETQETIQGEFVEEPQSPTGEAQTPDPLSIQFIATLAGVNTAAKPVNFDIDGAAKISLETDESQTPNVVALLALKRARLLVTVVVDTSGLGATPEVGTKRRGRKKVQVA